MYRPTEAATLAARCPRPMAGAFLCARKTRFPFTGSATTDHVGGVVETALMAILTSTSGAMPDSIGGSVESVGCGEPGEPHQSRPGPP
ncbi:hypothetical protein SZ55_4894 [Pseudomonas sp. FeS53a]|nr:hypothetical protein SZ55_4894 [Pseudomonas sp. FeS53a]